MLSITSRLSRWPRTGPVFLVLTWRRRSVGNSNISESWIKTVHQLHFQTSCELTWPGKAFLLHLSVCSEPESVPTTVPTITVSPDLLLCWSACCALVAHRSADVLWSTVSGAVSLGPCCLYSCPAAETPPADLPANDSELSSPCQRKPALLGVWIRP